MGFLKDLLIQEWTNCSDTISHDKKDAAVLDHTISFFVNNNLQYISLKKYARINA